MGRVDCEDVLVDRTFNVKLDLTTSGHLSDDADGCANRGFDSQHGQATAITARHRDRAAEVYHFIVEVVLELYVESSGKGFGRRT